MKRALLKTALLSCAILVALVGTACAFDLVEPDVVCRWYFIGGKWIQVCM